MNNMFLVRPAKEDEHELIDMMIEWEQRDERIVPGILKNYKPDYNDFLNLLDRCHNGIGLTEKQVPSTLFILKELNGNVLGALSLRHYLSDDLRNYGGHMGYGIRPSKRNNGLGKKLLALGLLNAMEFGLQKVFIHCDKDNIASSKVIEGNNGILEWEGYYEPVERHIKRYVVDLNSNNKS